MNHIEAEQYGNLQARLLHCDVLNFVRTPRAAHIQCRAEQPLAHHFEMLVPIPAVAVAVEYLQLTELLRERHPRK